MAEVGHVPVAYPSLPDGVHSLQHLAKGLLGSEPVPRNDLIAHGWVAAGAGLAQAFPTNPLMGTGALPTLTEAENATLREFTAMRADETAAIDWKKWLPIILNLLLKFVG